MAMDRKAIVIAVLIILLVVAGGYIAFTKWNEAKQKEQLGIYQSGAQYGYEQAIIQIAQQASTCEQVPLRIGNQTLNIIAVDCLKQAGK